VHHLCQGLPLAPGLLSLREQLALAAPQQPELGLFFFPFSPPSAHGLTTLTQM